MYAWNRSAPSEDVKKMLDDAGVDTSYLHSAMEDAVRSADGFPFFISLTLNFKLFTSCSGTINPYIPVLNL